MYQSVNIWTRISRYIDVLWPSCVSLALSFPLKMYYFPLSGQERMMKVLLTASGHVWALFPNWEVTMHCEKVGGKNLPFFQFPLKQWLTENFFLCLSFFVVKFTTSHQEFWWNIEKWWLWRRWYLPPVSREKCNKNRSKPESDCCLSPEGPTTASNDF